MLSAPLFDEIEDKHRSITAWFLANFNDIATFLPGLVALEQIWSKYLLLALSLAFFITFEIAFEVPLKVYSCVFICHLQLPVPLTFKLGSCSEHLQIECVSLTLYLKA